MALSGLNFMGRRNNQPRVGVHDETTTTMTMATMTNDLEAADSLLHDEDYRMLNSLTPKSVPAGTKLVLFGRYVLIIYVGIVRYFLRKTKTQRAKIYLPTQRTNRRISYDIN